MFPHTITIFNIVDNVYYRQVVSNVLFLSERIISQDGMGEKYANVHRVIFSKESLLKYKKKANYKPNKGVFTLNDNDIIVEGEIEQINAIKDLQNGKYDYFLIKTISDNNYGSEDMQNIEVTD